MRIRRSRLNNPKAANSIAPFDPPPPELAGAGLAGGFPIMLGFAGDRFSNLSGTAFSFIFVTALIGNMLINFLMGLIVHNYGVEHLTTVSYAEVALMALLLLFIAKDLREHKNQ